MPKCRLTRLTASLRRNAMEIPMKRCEWEPAQGPVSDAVCVMNWSRASRHPSVDTVAICDRRRHRQEKLPEAPRNAAKPSSYEQMTAMLLETEANSDPDLIGRARDGDRDAFGRLVARHYDFIYRVAWRWAGNRSDAEDIAQDVCVRLGKAIRSYKGGAAFTTWLYAMTLNAARDLRRKSTR